MNIEKDRSEKANFLFLSVAWLIAIITFFYTFIQIDMLSPLGAILMYTFHWNAATLGTMSAMYFYACFLIIFPAGLLLDRYSPRKLCLLLCLSLQFQCLLLHCRQIFGDTYKPFYSGSVARLDFWVPFGLSLAGFLKKISPSKR